MSGSTFNVQRSKLKLKRVDLLNAQTGFFYGTLKWRGNAVMNLNVHDELLILFPRESRRSINGVESTLSAERWFCVSWKDLLQFLGKGIQPERRLGIRKHVDVIFGLEKYRTRT